MSGATPHVLFLLRGLEDDGPGRLACGLLRCFQPADIRVSVLSLAGDGPMRGDFERESSRLGGHFATHPTGWLGVRRAGARIAELAREWGVGLIHTHLLRADAAGRIARDLLGAIPYVVTEHALHGWGERGPLLRPFVKSWYLRSLSERSTIVAISEWEHGALLAEGVPATNIRTILNGVDLAEFTIPDAERRGAARAKLGIAKDALPVVLTLGVLTRRKAPELTLRAVAEMRRGGGAAVALIAGSGPRAEYLARLAGELLPPDGAKLTGFLGNPTEALDAADVLMHPSIEEPYGLVVAEALACGIPVVTRRGTGAAELLPDAPGGRVVFGNDPAAWSAALVEAANALRRDPETVASQCRTHALQHCGIGRCAAEYLDLYRELTAPSPRPPGS